MQARIFDQSIDASIGSPYPDRVMGQVGEVQIALFIHHRSSRGRQVGKRLHTTCLLVGGQLRIRQVADARLRPGALQWSVVQPLTIGTDLQRVGVDPQRTAVGRIQRLSTENDVAQATCGNGGMPIQHAPGAAASHVDDDEPGLAGIGQKRMPALKAHIVDVATR
ncbi:hypothetical protein D3C77_463480 [compost metagenome]